MSTYLSHVKDLKTVALGFGANIGIPVNNLDVPPVAGNCLGGQTTEIGKFSLLANLDKGGTVGLANGTKLSALRRGPA